MCDWIFPRSLYAFKFTKVAQLGRDPYAALREFIHGVEDTARLGMVKARKKAHRERRAPPSSQEFVFFAQEMTQVRSLDGDADVQWVLKGQEDAWYRRRSANGHDSLIGPL